MGIRRIPSQSRGYRGYNDNPKDMVCNSEDTFNNMQIKLDLMKKIGNSHHLSIDMNIG